MQHEALAAQIQEHIKACTDESLLDLIWKLLIESGY